MKRETFEQARELDVKISEWEDVCDDPLGIDTITYIALGHEKSKRKILYNIVRDTIKTKAQERIDELKEELEKL